jgi:hypothetical protein
MSYSAPTYVDVDDRGSPRASEAERFTQLMRDVGARIGADD